MKRSFVWILWTGAAMAATLTITFKLQSTDRSLFLPGRTTSGHYQIELSCDSCHTPYLGVLSAACLQCHEQDLKVADDSHPKSKFTDPRNAERIARLDATSCIACHVEHRPEVTSAMGLTLPSDYCFFCHSDIDRERPSHKGMAFNTCASGGCHNFHDNRALYTDFLVSHSAEPDLLDRPAVIHRGATPASEVALIAERYDSPKTLPLNPGIVEEWASTTHARSGVNCSGCHDVADESGVKKWMDRPGYKACQSCHKGEADGFLGGKHGMRLAAGLSPMSPGFARLPMAPAAASRTLGCGSCHTAHEFDTRRAAADACLECHADKHSLAYKASRHFELWRAEINGNGAAGSGVSCATCHLPRLTVEDRETKVVRAEHNQNSNLRPNEKMIRDVCRNCHGLRFSIDALADSELVEVNFRGPPSRRVDSIDMALRKVAR